MQDFFKNFILKIEIIRILVACTIMCGFLGIVVALISKDIPEANKDILIHVLGTLDSALLVIIGYYYGASKKHSGDDQPNNTQK